MDLRAEFDQLVDGMQWEELRSTLEEAVMELLRGTGHRPPPTAAPQVPARPGFSSHPRTAASQSGGCFPPSILQPPHLYGQAGAPSQAQCSGGPAVPERTGGPAVPERTGQWLHPAAVLVGQLLYEVVPAAPPLNTSTIRKKRRARLQRDNRPYVKKPPNAFMLYLKEQRPKVKAELSTTPSALLNAALGERWLSLSEEEQAKYFDQANQEKQLHAQRHPEWSSRDNYGTRMTKQRRRAPARAEGVAAPASRPKETEQCWTPAQTERPCPQAAETVRVHLPQTQSSVVDLHHLQMLSLHPEAPSMVAVYHTCHPLQVYEASLAAQTDSAHSVDA